MALTTAPITVTSTLMEVIEKVLKVRTDWCIRKYFSIEKGEVIRLCLPFEYRHNEPFIEDNHLDAVRRIIGNNIYLTIDFVYDKDLKTFVHKGSGSITDSEEFERFLQMLEDGL